MKNITNVGGEFESKNILKADKFIDKFNEGSWFTSGRAAFLSIVKHLIKEGKKTIYLPAYSCDSLSKVINNINIEIKFYDIDKKFKPILKNIKKNSIVLLINYFGIKNNENNYSDKSIVIINDLSHNFLQNNLKFKKNQFYFFSCRKFGLFNFGGWVNYNYKKKNYSNQIYLSKLSSKIRYRKYKYIHHSIKDPIYEKKLLVDFKNLENRILKSNKTIKKKYIKLITKISYKDFITNRRKKYFYLKKNLRKINLINLNLGLNAIPLGFFLLIKDRDKLRNHLKKNNIFCPIHWRIKKNIISKKSNAFYFSKHLITIPIDHRYSIKDLNFIIKKINELYPKNIINKK